MRRSDDRPGLRSITTRDRATARHPFALAFLFGFMGAAGVVAAAVFATPVAMNEDAAQVLPALEPAATDGVEEAGSDGEDADTITALPTVSYELFLARDPFEPVVPEPEPEPDPDDPADPDDPGDPDDPDAPVDPDDPADPSDPAEPGDPSNGVANGPCTGDTEVVCDGRVLTVIEVFEENGEFVAVIQVDTMRYEVRAGDTFVDVFEVVSISAEEVRLLFGDRVVRIRVGDNALK